MSRCGDAVTVIRNQNLVLRKSSGGTSSERILGFIRRQVGVDMMEPFTAFCFLSEERVDLWLSVAVSSCGAKQLGGLAALLRQAGL